MCHDIHTKFHKDWFRGSKVVKGRIHIQTHRQLGDLISLLLFFKNKETRLIKMKAIALIRVMFSRALSPYRVSGLQPVVMVVFLHHTLKCRHVGNVKDSWFGVLRCTIHAQIFMKLFLHIYKGYLYPFFNQECWRT
jgi:hypothetical protein